MQIGEDHAFLAVGRGSKKLFFKNIVLG